MQSEQDMRRINEQTVRDFLHLLAEKNMDDWADLWTEDAVQEMPFSPAGFPTKVEGRLGATQALQWATEGLRRDVVSRFSYLSNARSELGVGISR